MNVNEKANAQSSDPLALFAAGAGALTPEDAMRIHCKRLLRDAGSESGVVPQSRLLSTLGARREDVAVSTPGRLRIDDDGYLICVRADTQWRRARFTVAHEMGHILLCEGLKEQPNALRMLQTRTHWDRVERLCNQAAAELLMPAEDFRPQVDGQAITPSLLKYLRDRYGVSWSALALRFKEILGYAVSSWTKYQRHPDERVTFRVERSWGSGVVWLPTGLTTRYLKPDLINRAAVDGEAAGHGVLAFGGRSNSVRGIAVSLALADASLGLGDSFDEVDALAPKPLGQRVLLFLSPSQDGDQMDGGEKPSLEAQQLVLLT